MISSHQNQKEKKRKENARSAYLFSDGEENFASEIHEKYFATAFSVVVINSINDVSIRIKDCAAICVVN